MEYLPWLIAAALAVLAAVIIRLFVAEKKQRRLEDEKHTHAILALENEKRAVEEEREAAISEGKRKERLIELIVKTHMSSDGKVKIFGFENESNEQLFGTDGEELKGTYRKLPRTLYQSLRSGELDCIDTQYAVTAESDGESRVYVLNDVTDKYKVIELESEIDCLKGEIGELGSRIDELEGDKSSLGAKIESLEDDLSRSDIITDVMNIEYFTENAEMLAGDGEAWLMFIKTEADLPQAASFGKSRELYLKSFAKSMLEAFDGIKIARYSEDSFVCMFSGITAEELGKNAETAVGMLAEHSKLLSLCDDRYENRNVLEISRLKRGRIKELVFCLSIKAAHDRRENRYGVLEFTEQDLEAILGYEQGMEKIIDKKSVRFTYRPIARSSDAKIFAYHAEPYFPNTPFKSVKEAVDGSMLFGYTEEFEKMVYDECLRRYKSCIADGRMLYNTRVILNSTPNTCMTNKAALEFYEKYYVEVKNIITEIPERIPSGLDSARVKKRRADAWNASCIMDMGADVKDNSLKIGLLSPDIVRVDAAIACGEHGREVIGEIRREIKAYDGMILIDGISSAAELREAIAVGAELLAGAFVGGAGTEPQDINDRCIKEIGYKRFGKRGKS